MDESLPEPGIRGLSRCQQLERHAAAQALIVGPLDNRHTARTDLLLEPVPGDLAASDGLVAHRICPSTGRPPGEGTKRTRLARFVAAPSANKRLIIKFPRAANNRNYDRIDADAPDRSTVHITAGLITVPGSCWPCSAGSGVNDRLGDGVNVAEDPLDGHGSEPVHAELLVVLSDPGVERSYRGDR